MSKTSLLREIQAKGTMHRAAAIRADAINEDARTVEIAFSSEEPYLRFYGYEVLDHNEKAVVLDRMNNGAAFLLQHDPERQIGVIESARIDADKVGRAVVRFSRSAAAEEVWQDVRDGIRTKISVGYSVDQIKLHEKGKDTEDTYLVTKWTPFEASLVSIAADDTVGVGRAHTHQEEAVEMAKTDETKDTVQTETRADTPTVEAPATPAPAPVTVNDSQRSADIMKMGMDFNMLQEAHKAIEDGTDSNDFRGAVLAKLRERNQREAPQAARLNPAVQIPERDRTKYRLVDAIKSQIPGAKGDFGLVREVSEEISRTSGKSTEGILVPRWAVVPNVETRVNMVNGNAAALVGTEHLDSQFIEALRGRQVLPRLGITVLDGLPYDAQIPIQTGKGSTYWIGEEEEPTTSDQIHKTRNLTPKTVAANTKISRKLIMLSSPAAEQLAREDLMKEIALELDKQGIQGDGTGGKPLGLEQASDLGSVTLDGSNITYQEALEMLAEIMKDDADLGSMRWLMTPTAWSLVASKSKDTGSGLFVADATGRSIAGYPYEVSNQVRSYYVWVGVWSQMIQALWGSGMDMIVDPYTYSSSGKVQVTMFNDVDYLVRHGESFCYTTGVTS